MEWLWVFVFKSRGTKETFSCENNKRQELYTIKMICDSWQLLDYAEGSVFVISYANHNSINPLVALPWQRLYFKRNTKTYGRKYYATSMLKIP
jgi:hypothetical protein